jgi:hypothetical protein
MEKECAEIRITPTETGLRIDINGKNLDKLCSCGCMKIVRGESETGKDCCPETDKQKPGCC